MTDRIHWDLIELNDPPSIWSAEEYKAAGVMGVFFENVPYKGQPTRVFAWIGLPDLKSGVTCPGMILLHGGGGTAFAEWVRLWNHRGYAAIAFDQCGCVPANHKELGGEEQFPHAYGGPPGWDASFDAVGEEIKDQWGFHVIAAVSRARAILASQPGVNAERIGVTGISWGGYMTSLAAGVVPGLACAIPVYGCGFLGENSYWKDEVYPSKPRKAIERWQELWDPSHYLPSAKLPMCWISGTNDFAYPLDSLQKSYSLPSGEKTLCIRVEMPHSHQDGWAPAEIGVFADSQLCGGAPLPQLKSHGVDGKILWAEFESARPILSAEINFTRATGQWQDRKYNRLPVRFVSTKGRVEAVIPTNTTVCFLNVFDDRGCISSTPHQELSGNFCKIISED